MDMFNDDMFPDDIFDAQKQVNLCEKRLASAEYAYAHNDDKQKATVLAKSVDYWSERTADAYHRLSLCEDGEEDYDPLLLREGGYDEADYCNDGDDKTIKDLFKDEPDSKADNDTMDDDEDDLIADLFGDSKEVNIND